MRVNRLMVLVVAAVLGVPCSANGLERLIEVPETSVEQRRAARQKYLDELISSIQKASDLTEGELRRLQVASKGAVEYSFTDELNTNESRSGRRELGGLEIWGGKLRMVNSLDAAAATQHPIWTRTLERTLTSEQLEKAKTLAQQQLERWTQRFGPQPVIWRGGKVRGGVRGFREVQPIEVNKIRRLDLIADPPPGR